MHGWLVTVEKRPIASQVYESLDHAMQYATKVLQDDWGAVEIRRVWLVDRNVKESS